MPNRFLICLLLPVLGLAACAGTTTDPLPSWRDGPTKSAILNFVQAAADPGSSGYIPPRERIATFDNDGTLWAEQPAYFQLLFATDRVRAMAPDRPEWRGRQPYQAAIDRDMAAVAESGHKGVAELVMTTHAGMTTDEFAETARAWLATARHPDSGRPYTQMVYQPMLELLDHLRANGFKTFIVSGGGVEFLRVFAEDVYGIPPEQVIGSRIKTDYEMTPSGPVLRRLPEIDFIDDKAGKPIAINAIIGRRPVAAFGNSDGDLQMLQWTAAANGPSLCAIVHHTDAAREWAYDRDGHIGRLAEALDQARTDGWTVIDIEDDWEVVFPR